MKKVLLNFSVVCVAAALGLAVGFALRSKRVRHVSSAPPIGAASPTETLRTSKQRVPARLDDDSPLTTRLEYDLSMSSGVTRWLYWLEALESAAASDFPRLFHLAE